MLIKLLTVLREAINFNKYDIDKAYMGKLSDYVFKDYDDMDEFDTSTTEIGQYAVVLRGIVGGGPNDEDDILDTVGLYEWSGAAWVFVDDAVGFAEVWKKYLEN